MSSTADQFHIILHGYRVGDALADDAVAVDGHANFLIRHLNLRFVECVNTHDFNVIEII